MDVRLETGRPRVPGPWPPGPGEESFPKPDGTRQRVRRRLPRPGGVRECRGKHQEPYPDLRFMGCTRNEDGTFEVARRGGSGVEVS